MKLTKEERITITKYIIDYELKLFSPLSRCTITELDKRDDETLIRSYLSIKELYYLSNSS